MPRSVPLLFLIASAWAVQAEDAVDRGAYLVTAAGCVTCHTDIENDGEPWAGGHPLETPYGVFYTPNITPDKETGIGNWTADEFVTAVRDGVGPEGQHYFPSFPFPSYAGMTEGDARDMFAFLQTLGPVTRPNRPHELKWYVPGRWSMRFWQGLFAPWNYPAIADADPAIERGAYLVRHLGHCGECHTPRNAFGALDTSRELAGSPKDSAGGGAPNITSDPDNGIGLWNDEELLFFLELGMSPDGDFAGGSMTAVIDEHTSLLTEEDRLAMVSYLRYLSPR